MLFLGEQPSCKKFSSGSENQEKTPGVETNPPPCPCPDFSADHANKKDVSSSKKVIASTLLYYYYYYYY